MKANFFGMNIDHTYPMQGADPKIQTTIASKRFWDDGCQWDLLNPAPGKFNSAPILAWLDVMRANKIYDGLFDMGRTPAWAAAEGSAPCCYTPCSCRPPKDLNADGTGPNQHWNDWIQFVLSVLPSNMTFHFAPWNEFTSQPNNISENVMWCGTEKQMVRLSADLYKAVKARRPQAMVMSPSIPIIGGKLGWDSTNFLNYWRTPGAQEACDVIAIHPYGPDAAELLASMAQFQNLISMTKSNPKPYWSTEGSWGAKAPADTAQYVHDYLAGSYKLVDRLYWYAYGPVYAPLVDDKNVLTAAGQEWNKMVIQLRQT